MFTLLAILSVLFALWLVDFVVFQLRGTGRSKFQPPSLLKGYRCKLQDCCTKDRTLLSPTDPKVASIPGKGPKQCPRCKVGTLEPVNRALSRWEAVRMAFGGARIASGAAVATAATVAMYLIRVWLGDPVLSHPTTLDLGFVEIGKSISKDIAIKNLGTGTLKVSVASEVGAELSFQSPSLKVEAGKQELLRVTYTPTTARSVSGRILLTSNTSQPPPAPITLKAEVGIHGAWWVFEELQKTSTILATKNPPASSSPGTVRP